MIPKKILCLFDYNCKTGFSTVSTNIKKQLKKRMGNKLQFEICAINYLGEPYSEPDGTHVISAAKSAPKHDDFGRYGFLKLLKEYDYEGIFIIQDLAVIQPIYAIIKKIKEDKKSEGKKLFKSVFYFPVDCPVQPYLLKGIDIFDKLVTYTQYGVEKIKESAPELNVAIINHGIDTDVFYPLHDDDKEEKRIALFGEESKDHFIICNINRNQLRKDIPQTLFAFKILKGITSIDKELKLYLHMNPIDPMGWNLPQIINQLGIADDVIFPKEEVFSSSVYTEEYLNGIYNACDLYLTTTLGEGWGLTLHEAAACKLPVVAPLITSFIEMTNNGQTIYGYQAKEMVCLGTDSVIRYKGNLQEIYHTIEDAIFKIEKSSENNHQIVDANYKSATNKSWELIGHYWHYLLKNFY